MIQRVGDFSTLSNDSFEKIAKVVEEKDNKKLYKICSCEEEVSIASKEIKLSGYNCQIEKIGDQYNVYSFAKKAITLNEAEQSGSFKKLAWGRYCFQKSSSINNFLDYNFDDGSIWRVISNDNGQQFLIKETEENDEDEVIRKTASINKIASSEIVTEQNYKQIIHVLYPNFEEVDFFKDIMNINIIEKEIIKMLSDKINILITEKLQQYNIVDTNIINNIKDELLSQINSKKIIDKNSLEESIYNYIEKL